MEDKATMVLGIILILAIFSRIDFDGTANKTTVDQLKQQESFTSPNVNYTYTPIRYNDGAGAVTNGSNNLNNNTTNSLSLENKTWTWIESVESNRLVRPLQSGRFSVSFVNGNIQIRTDCNGGSASYTKSGSTLRINSIASTMMYCDGSQESVFFNMLQGVQSYSIQNNELSLNYGNGVLFFK